MMVEWSPACQSKLLNPRRQSALVAYAAPPHRMIAGCTLRLQRTARKQVRVAAQADT